MKRVFTSLLMLAAMLVSTTTWAGNLKIAGVNVSTSGSSVVNVTGSGISGTVQYNPSNNTIYLTNATITSSSTDAIRFWGFDSSTNIYIVCSGKNTVTCSSSNTSDAGIYVQNTVYIQSKSGEAATLTVKNTGAGCALNVEAGWAVEYRGIHFIASASNNNCMYGRDNNKLGCAYTWLAFSAPSGYAAVTGFSSFASFMNGIAQCVISKMGQSFSSSKGGFVNSSGNLDNEAYVNPTLTIGEMPIYIGGDQSYTTSSTTAGKMGLTAGTITWTASSKTLTLNGVTLKNTSTDAITTRLSGLTINLVGTNTITASDDCIEYGANLSITGDGSLTATSSNFTAIHGYNQHDETLTISVNNKVKFVGKQVGINCAHWNGYNTNNDLILKKAGDNSDYYFTGNIASVRDVSHLVLTDMDFYTGSDGTPGSYFDEKNHYVAQTGGAEVNTTVNFYRVKTKYDIWVAGQQINECNRYALGSPYLTAGKVSFDGTTSLTLEGVTIKGQGSPWSAANCGVYSQIANLVINATGTNNITTSNVAFALGGNTTIKGSGTLNLTSGEEHGISMFSSANLTLQRSGGIMTIKGDGNGFSGSSSTLTINKDGSGATYKFAGVSGNISAAKLVLGTDVFINTAFTWFNEAQKAVYYKDGVAKSNNVEGGTSPNVATWILSDEPLTTYPIYIAGTQLNHRNSTGFYNQYVKGGTITYDNSSKTLTLKDATISGLPSADSKEGMAVHSEVNGLTINATGTNNITAYNTAIDLGGGGTVTLKGSGDLSITSQNASAISVYSNTGLTLQRSGGTSKFMGAAYGYYGLTSTNLTINKDGSNGALYEFAGSKGNIYKTGFVLGDGVKIHSKWTWFNSSEQSIYIYGGLSKTDPANIEGNGTWIRGDITWTEYPIYVAGTKLYGAIINGDVKGNAGGFCNQYCTTEGVSYDPSTKTLKLNNAKVDMAAVATNCVQNEGVDDLTIDVTGTSTLNCANSSGMSSLNLWKNTTIKGTGTLKLTGSEGDLYGRNSTITLQNINLEAEGDIYSSTSSKLVVNLIDKTKKVTAAKGVYGWAGGIELGGSTAVVEPEGATISDGAVKLSGSNATNVVFQSHETYNITIAGVVVSEDNAADVLGNGIFKYDKASNTLTIKGNYTFTGSGNVIESYNEDLTIKVAGNSTIVSTSNNAIIRLYANTTITGGKLTMMCTHSSNDGLGIYLSEGTLTLKDATIDITGDGFGYGITGETTCSLVIDNCEISASSHLYGAIFDWGDITLIGCYVADPRPTQISAYGGSKVGVRDESGNVIGGGTETGTVVIKAGEDAIESIDNAAAAPTEVYDVAGRKLDQTRRGINIVRKADGKTVKVLKK